MYPKMATAVFIPQADEELQGDLELFEALAQSRELEDAGRAPLQRPEELPDTSSKAAPKHREAPGPQPGPMQKSPSGGLANARQGRVAVAQEGRLLFAPRKGAKLGAALRFFSLSFSAACLVSSVLGVSGPRCFEENGDGAEALLGALGRCRELQDGAEGVNVFPESRVSAPFSRKSTVAGEVAVVETVE